MRRKLVAGNWKMFGEQARVNALVAELAAQDFSQAAVDVAIIPGFINLQSVQQQLADTGIELGAQDCAEQLEYGALTGEVSALQLAELGCRYVLVGHSERRALQSESDQVICRKFIAAQKAGLIPILCLGETLAQREAGLAAATVCEQLEAVMEQVGVDAFEQAVIAYEPVWAIGTGLTATPEQAQEIHQQIRQRVAEECSDVAAQVQILYGGSVKAANAAELFAMADIDGGLVGGASLDAKEFSAIVSALGN